MTGTSDIDITGCDLVALAKKAYELSRPQGMGFLHARPGGLTDEEAAALVCENSPWPLDMDYVRGRAVKLSVRKDKATGRLYMRPSWYDHTDDQLAQLLAAVRPATGSAA